MTAFIPLSGCMTPYPIKNMFWAKAKQCLESRLKMKAAGYLAYQPSFTPLQGEGEGGWGLETLRKPLEKSDEVEFWHIWLCNLKIMDHTSYNLFLAPGFIFLLFLRQIFLLSLLQFIILLKTENLLYCSNLYWKKIIYQSLKFKICNQKFLQLAR